MPQRRGPAKSRRRSRLQTENGPRDKRRPLFPSRAMQPRDIHSLTTQPSAPSISVTVSVFVSPPGNVRVTTAV